VKGICGQGPSPEQTRLRELGVGCGVAR
jgi:hypothetical protein